jgi:hypothetical protein
VAKGNDIGEVMEIGAQGSAGFDTACESKAWFLHFLRQQSDADWAFALQRLRIERALASDHEVGGGDALAQTESFRD